MDASEFAKKMEELGELYKMPKGHVLQQIQHMGMTGMQIAHNQGDVQARLYFQLQYSCAAKHLRETRSARPEAARADPQETPAQGLAKSSSAGASE